jgi:hypothetical protein
MNQHKNDVANMIDLLAYSLKGFDPDGVEMHLSVAGHSFKEKNAARLVDKFRSKSSFQNTCNMAHCLRRIFRDYKEKIKHHARGFPLTPMNIYVLTNAVWQPQCEVKEEIIKFVQFLAEKVPTKMRQVGIQFIRFGSDPEGIRRLEILDRLKEKGDVDRYAISILPRSTMY